MFRKLFHTSFIACRQEFWYQLENPFYELGDLSPGRKNISWDCNQNRISEFSGDVFGLFSFALLRCILSFTGSLHIIVATYVACFRGSLHGALRRRCKIVAGRIVGVSSVIHSFMGFSCDV